MRIKIALSSAESGCIDFNYQHQIQAVIYSFLASSDPDYASWLHEQGFVYKNDKRFKLFVFSGITFHGPIKIKSSNRSNSSNRLNGLSGLNSLNGLNGLLLKPLESPIFVKKPMPSGQKDKYLFPGDEEYEELLNQNLMHKYETLYGKPYKGELLKFNFQIEQFERLERFEPKLFKSFKVFKDGKVIGEIKGTLQILSIAKGSCGEVRCQLYVAGDQGYVDNKESGQLIDAFRKLSIMINNFMDYLKRRPYD